MIYRIFRFGYADVNLLTNKLLIDITFSIIIFIILILGQQSLSHFQFLKQGKIFKKSIKSRVS